MDEALQDGGRAYRTEILAQQTETFIKLDEALQILANQNETLAQHTETLINQDETLQSLQSLAVVVSENAKLKERIEQQDAVIIDLLEIKRRREHEDDGLPQSSKRVKFEHSEAVKTEHTEHSEAVKTEHSEDNGLPQSQVSTLVAEQTRLADVE